MSAPELSPRATGPPWRAVAACRHTDPALFYPNRAAAPDDDAVARALEICGRCPVRTFCLQAGIDEPFGIWGGTTEEERRELRRVRRQANRRFEVPEIDLRRV